MFFYSRTHLVFILPGEPVCATSTTDGVYSSCVPLVQLGGTTYRAGAPPYRANAPQDWSGRTSALLTLTLPKGDLGTFDGVGRANLSLQCDLASRASACCQKGVTLTQNHTCADSGPAMCDAASSNGQGSVLASCVKGSGEGLTLSIQQPQIDGVGTAQVPCCESAARAPKARGVY